MPQQRTPLTLLISALGLKAMTSPLSEAQAAKSSLITADKTTKLQASKARGFIGASESN